MEDTKNQKEQLTDELKLLLAEKQKLEMVLSSSEGRARILSKEVTELEHTVASLNKQIEAANREINKLSENIKTKEQDRQSLTFQVSDLNLQQAELKDIVENLNTRKVNFEQVVSDLEERDKQLTESVSLKEESIKVLQSTIDALSNERIKISEEHSKEQTILASFLDESVKTKSRLTKEIDTLKQAKDAIRIDEAKAKYDLQVQEMKAKFDRLQAEEMNKLNILQMSFEKLSQDFEDKRKEAAEFEKKFNKLVVEENQKLQDTRDMVGSLKAEIERLEAIKIRSSLK